MEAKENWALGYEVIPFAERDREGLYGHTGDNPGYHALLFVHPTERDALIVLSNGDAGNVFRNLLLPTWCGLTGHGGRFPIRKVPVGMSLLGVLARHGAEAAKSEYFRRQRDESETFAFGPRQLDRLANALASAGRSGAAQLFYEFNVEQYPDSPLALASLTERYLEIGRLDEADALC